MLQRISLAFALTLLLAYSSLALSNSPVFNSIHVTQLEQIMQQQGYTVEVDSDGDILWRLDGMTMFILVQDTALQFYSVLPGVESSLETVNEWNRTKRYSRSYLDSDQDPVLELDLDLAGGVTEDRIIDFLSTCRLSFSAWLKEVM